MSEELMTVGEASKKLSVSPRTVQRYCKQGLLNHKWIRGKRHKELRIVPPIPLSLLPGVKQGSAPGAGDLVTRKELEELFASFNRELAERDRHIDAQQRVESLLEDFETVRPVEKKLILKLARELQSQNKFLRTLGYKENTDEG
jgi:hypothetical protein